MRSWLMLALFLLALPACRGSGGIAPRLTVTVTPATATVSAGGAGVTFTAEVRGSTDDPVWTLSGPGSVAPATGKTTTYTPPSSADGTVTLTATVTTTGRSASGSAIITIIP